jgi:hypothetical protein
MPGRHRWPETTLHTSIAKAQFRARKIDMMPSIFVSIASYRDSECPATIRDLFEKAAFPARIRVGVLWQVVPGEDDDCLAIADNVPREQLRSLTVHASESQGACWARHRIQAELWQGEDYYLQIDSHMRFTAGWDERLIAMLMKCATPRAVLATYPAAYTPPGHLGAPLVPVLAPKQFDENRILLLSGRPLEPREIPERPVSNAFIAAGFLFAPGSVVREVPYDPHLYFHGEEITLAVRLWTHGFDLFAPNEHVIYHDYSTDRARPRHWSDNRDWSARNQRSLSRARHLLGMERSEDPEVLRDMDRYGLGTARTLDEYQRFADIDFAQRHIGERAVDGRFPLAPSAEPHASLLRRRFHSIYMRNQWRSRASRSGSGSTRASTASVRPALRELFAELGVRNLVDAGCGEFGWLLDVTRDLNLYLGYDLVPDLINRNLAMCAEQPVHAFAIADVTRQLLPRADMILCRHCLTHLPDRDVRATLDLFRRSGSRWLLATTYAPGDDRDIDAGHWRAIDLAHPRFGLGAAGRLIVDLPGKGGAMLGLWDLENEPCQD